MSAPVTSVQTRAIYDPGRMVYVTCYRCQSMNRHTIYPIQDKQHDRRCDHCAIVYDILVDQEKSYYTVKNPSPDPLFDYLTGKSAVSA